MIYKFKSKAAGDVIMLQAHGDQLMRLIGRGNWWYPGWAGRITPRLSIEGPARPVEPAPVAGPGREPVGAATGARHPATTEE